jgi:hypothetical protein
MKHLRLVRFPSKAICSSFQGKVIAVNWLGYGRLPLWGPTESGVISRLCLHVTRFCHTCQAVMHCVAIELPDTVCWELGFSAQVRLSNISNPQHGDL